MTATEKLRALLDEMGVRWELPQERWNDDCITYWYVGDIKWVAFEGESGKLWLNCNSMRDLTPEQAIASTVGNVGYCIQFADWCEFPPETMVGETVFDGEGNAFGWITNATVGRETLTAEQVRECAKGVYFEGYSDGATHRGHGIEETDWQTIADKLNVTLGVGTCKLAIEKRPRHGPWIYHFGCGYDFWQPTDCPMPVLKHCPNCGKRIEVSE